ncbi:MULTISPECIES: UDP-3-O-(3-hydroxymyristoyl)glucosamine N-acyltransferase [unclassified Prosthecochloris]|uniref:UDP-3-O-(3-hydroxymyristoyl)glucosamine N-acyltransferase n=1 Tax=unclassified Prosthecochloris TaxID=2632826 RepID=UPI00223CF94B|nr:MULTISPECIES: UDP-3-O-(3-hydroxymyristoyl)glucosamine N-acyltransferase [unclassified Prosthecochloris]UZJ36685.1 UDP-3-O-(3-hydroxymyristoyl)glucosamine N-acyltransferase [Prosthecochloris sp. SCSIO W1103]
MKIYEIQALLERYFDKVELVGSSNITIDGPAKIECAAKGNVSFVANEKYTRFIESTEASLLIVGEQTPTKQYSDSLSFLKVKDPYTAFVFVLQMFSSPRVIASDGVSPSAVIGENVMLGKNVSIGDHVVIGDHCVIGDNTVIGPNTVLMERVVTGRDCMFYPGVICYDGTILGDRVTIHSGTVLGADGFGFAPQPDGGYIKIPQMGIVEIHDDVEIGANNTIDRATMGSTVIEKGVKIDNLVQIAHNCRIGENTVIASQAGISGSVSIGKHCMIGGQAGFAGHLSLPDKTHVAAKAGVSKSLQKSAQTLRGIPAQPIRDQLRQEALLRSLDKMKRKLDALEEEVRQMQKGKGQQAEGKNT